MITDSGFILQRTLSWVSEYFGKLFQIKKENKYCNLNIRQILENYLLYMARRLWSSYKPKTEKSILKHYVSSGHIINEGIACFVLYKIKCLCCIMKNTHISEVAEFWLRQRADFVHIFHVLYSDCTNLF